MNNRSPDTSAAFAPDALSNSTGHRPLVVSFAAHDPTAGAGLSADLAVFAALGCQPAGVLTGLTVQDTVGVTRFEALSSDWVVEQTDVLLADCTPSAFKTGALCSPDVVRAVAACIRRFPAIPLVIDPVLASGRGDSLSQAGLREALLDLLPLATLLTPNLPEAHVLSGQRNPVDAVHWLLDHGAQAVLLTGGHDETTGAAVVNTLYSRTEAPVYHRCLRLQGQYHGSGCTLASALAAFLAQGQALHTSVAGALQYTWETLAKATRPGSGQSIPDRSLGRVFDVRGFAGKS